MPSRDEQFRDLRSYPRGELESPFLEGELFADEVEAEREPHLAPLVSPFQHTFEYGSESLLEAERYDDEVCQEHEESDTENFSPWSEEVFEPFSAEDELLSNEEARRPVKEPKPVSGVEFAPAPPSGSFWPLRTTHPRDREVAYQAADGSFVGSPGRAFKGGREGGARYHVGIDLFAKLGDPVVACEGGTIVNFHGFLGKTKALLVEHDSGVVVNYGEVAPDSLERAGLKLNDRVKAGQVIGYVGLLPKGSSMLHFETYRKGTRSSKPWRPGRDRPREILNPTQYLLYLQEYGSGGGAQSVPPGAGGSLASLPRQLADAVRKGLLTLQVALTMMSGERDENRLTNAIFSARHPERDPSQKIQPHEKQFVREWLDIRGRIVRPALAALRGAPSPRPSPEPSSPPPAPTPGPDPVSGGASPLNVLSPSELKAVRITSTFETGRAGSFGGLTGNFDGQGVSFGLMNFAWKAGSLLTLLKEFLRDHPAAFAEVFGPDADMFREMVLATKPDPKNPKRQIRDLDRQMEFARNVLNDEKKKIREPWRTYFGRLENNPEFQRIQVKAVRKAAERARYWCDYFGLKTERAFAFMFDLVSSAGGAWLNAPKFKDRRRNLLRAMLEKKQAAVGRTALTELETLEVIAHMIADVSSERWRDDVRVRKLWFVEGTGTVHGKFWDLAKDFGVTDARPDFGTPAGSKELLEEQEMDFADECCEADDLAREWEDIGDEQLLPWESSEGTSEALEDLAFDEGPLEELEEGVEELCEEEDPDIPGGGEEEFFAEEATPWEEAPPTPEAAWVEPEAEAYFPVETASMEEELALSEESWNEPEDEAEFEEHELDASLGKTLYLPIRLSQAVAPKVGVFIPSGFRPTAAVDLLVYFHGHIIPDCKTYPKEFNKTGMEYYWNTPLFRCLREDLAASGQQAILIAPTFVPIFGSVNGPPSKYGDLNQDGKFDFLIEETLAELRQRGELPAGAQVRNIVLSGHSAGGLPMQKVLAARNSLGTNIVECWGFECLYFGTSELAGWLKANPSRSFLHFRRPWRFGPPTKALVPHANFRDISDGTDHCLIVKEKWRQAIDGSPALRGGTGGTIPTPSPAGGAMSALLSLLTGLPGLAALPITFLNALLGGLRDENQLTNLIFHVRHPELAGRKLTAGDPQSLKDEWVGILRTIVRPALRRMKERGTSPGASPAPATAQPAPPAPTLPAPGDEEFTLTEWKLAPGKIVVARAGNAKKGTAVEIVQAPAVFLPEIIGMARDLAAKAKRPDLAGKLDPARWFKQFTRITFLGRPLKSGQYLHLEMAKLLKAIERKMVAEFGGNAKSVGDMLLNKSTEGIAGSRLVSSTATFSMHMFGLAVDVNYLGNPFIQSQEDIKALNNVLKNATLLMNRPTLSYQQGYAKDKFDSVQRLDALLETYFALLDQPAELARLVQASTSSEWNGLSAPEARTKIQKNLDNLAGLLARGGTRRDYFKQHAILDFDKRFVVQMEELGLSWGGHYGDMMHFDMRTVGVGLYVEKARYAYAKKVKDLAKRLFNEKKYGTHSPA